MASRSSFDSLAGEFGRRRFLTGALGSAVTLARVSPMFGATEFWNAKDPSTWNDEEIVILTTRSPWSREAVPNYKSSDDPTGMSDAAASMGGRGGGRREAPARIIVRWESAQPILDALKAPPFAADLAGHYVLTVTNLPIEIIRRGPRGETTPDDSLDRIQNGATLQARGKDPAEAGIARRTRIGSFLFGFSSDYLHLTQDDREILFTLDTETLTIKAKFDAKDMIYHGKLAL